MMDKESQLQAVVDAKNRAAWISFVLMIASLCVGVLIGPLPSAGITRLLRYYRPIRHPLAFDPFPGVAGYKVYLLPSDLHSGPGGLLQLLGASWSACRR